VFEIASQKALAMTMSWAAGQRQTSRYSVKPATLAPAVVDATTTGRCSAGENLIHAARDPSLEARRNAESGVNSLRVTLAVIADNVYCIHIGGYVYLGPSYDWHRGQKCVPR